MRHKLRNRLVAAVLGLSSAAIPALLEAQVSLSLKWLYTVETVYVADFTPGNATTNPDLLGITLVNGTGAAQQLQFELRVSMERPRAVELFWGATHAFMLADGVTQFTNRDLVQRGRDLEMREYEIGASAEDMQETVMQSGRLPAGEYVFHALVRTPQGIILDEAEVRIELSNPTRVELITPGRPYGETPPIETSPVPRFQWSTEGSAGGAEFRVRVARVDGAGSGEEAMQGTAAWESRTTSYSVHYPAAATALRLEPGATYAWQVTREVRTSGGFERVESPIYWFRMGGAVVPTATASADELAAQRAQQLLRALGLGPELAGFRPVGSLTVDGRTLGLEALEELLAAIASGQLPLISIRVR